MFFGISFLAGIFSFIVDEFDRFADSLIARKKVRKWLIYYDWLRMTHTLIKNVYEKTKEFSELNYTAPTDEDISALKEKSGLSDNEAVKSRRNALTKDEIESKPDSDSEIESSNARKITVEPEN